MHSDRRSSLSETRPLLEEAPPSYQSTNDVDVASVTTLGDAQPLNKFSRADINWILAGLWSGVFLGAFDGACEHHAVLSTA